MKSIFVHIVCYKDPELQPTLEHLFQQAKFPERVFVGLCIQYETSPLDYYNPQHFEFAHQVSQVNVPATESEGVCWARSQVDRLLKNEDFVLVTDCHMRFAENWDDALISEYESIEDEKYVMSCNPGSYTLPNSIQPNQKAMLRAAKKTFNADKTIRFRSIVLEHPPEKSLPGAFIAAGFLFGKSQFLRELPFDPYLSFDEEEISYAARLWTSGWNIYSSKQVVLYHLYNGALESIRPLFWRENAKVEFYKQRGLKRYYHLFNIQHSVDQSVLKDIDQYGLGYDRTLEEYEKYAGLDFKLQQVSERAYQAQFAFEPPHISAKKAQKFSWQPSLNSSYVDSIGDYLHFFLLKNQNGHDTYLSFYGKNETLLFYFPSEQFEENEDLLIYLKNNEKQLLAIGYEIILINQLSYINNKRLAEKYPVSFRILSDLDNEFGQHLIDIYHEKHTGCYFIKLSKKNRITDKIFCYYHDAFEMNLSSVLEKLQPVIHEPIQLNCGAPVLIIEDVFSSSYCDNIIELIKNKNLKEGTIGEGRIDLRQKSRLEFHLSQSHGPWLREFDKEIIQKCLPEIKRSFNTDITYRETYKLGVYDSSRSDHYGFHRDNWMDFDQYRLFSLTLNFNDDYQGGELYLPEFNAMYRLKRGSALIFSSKLFHQARPVTQGIRYMMVSFLFNQQSTNFNSHSLKSVDFLQRSEFLT